MAATHARLAGALLCVLPAVVMGQTDAGQPFISTLVLSGQQAPGAPGSYFESFDAPVTSDTGGIVFVARLESSSGALAASVWSVIDDQLRLELRQGDQVFHGATPVTVGSLTLPTVNDQHDVLVLAGHDDHGGWSATTPFERSGGQRGGASIAADGFAIPGVWSGDVLNGLYPPTINNAGDIAFAGHHRQGVWTTRSGELLPARMAGEHAWGSTQGKFLWFDRPVQNDAGTLAYKAIATYPSGDRPERTGIWINETDDRRRVAIEDMPVAGPGFSGTSFRDFSSSPRLSDNGRVAFHARVSGAATPSNDSAIWSEYNGALRAVVREGDLAANTGFRFRRFHPEFAFNAAGQVAFSAVMDSELDRNTGIFRINHNGTIRLVARENQRLPDAVGEVRFKMFDPPIMNDKGQLAFVVQLFGAETSSANNQALMYTDREINLRTVVRSGQVVYVGPGDSDGRVVDVIDLAGSEPGEGRRPLNERGEIVFRLSFTDGSSGVFKVSLACPADIATRGLAGDDPMADRPDGLVSYADLDLFTRWWTDGDPLADLSTSGTGPGQNAYGEPDGAVDQADFDYYMAIWVEGCL